MSDELARRLAKDPRAPMPPAMLVGALHDVIHDTHGASRPAKVVRR